MKILTTLATVMPATTATAESHLPDLGGQVVAVVTENAYPLLQFIKSGAAIGWEYDAMAEIARRLKMDVVYESSSWDAMIPAVSERQYDIGMTGITICEDRAEVVDFTDPYITSERVMLVRGDEDRFSDAAIFAADSDLLMAAKPGTTPFYVGVCDVLYGDEANPRIKTMGNLRGHGAGAAHGRR
jgi:polar amino acid transport system substrate-binding protein